MLASGKHGSEQLTQSTHHLPLASVDRLNQLLREGEVLHALLQNWVIGISEEIAVKIGSDTDPDHINNLQYINDHVPGVPAPRFLGALRGDRNLQGYEEMATRILKTLVYRSGIEGLPLPGTRQDLDIVDNHGPFC